MVNHDPPKKPGPAWRLLAEYLPSGDSGSGTTVVNWVIAAVQRLGLVDNQLEAIRRDVSRSLENAGAKLSLAGELPAVHLRIWVSDPNFAAYKRTRLANQPVPSGRHGWGFFLTTKTESPIKGRLLCFVDLFLYLEGHVQG